MGRPALPAQNGVGICDWCGAEFHYEKKGTYKNHRRRFCNRSCWAHWVGAKTGAQNRNPRPLVCQECGRMYGETSRKLPARRRFCSLACGTRHAWRIDRLILDLRALDAHDRDAVLAAVAAETYDSQSARHHTPAWRRAQRQQEETQP